MIKCFSPRLPQQHKDGGQERKKGGENREEWEKQTCLERESKEEDKQAIEKKGKRIVEGGLAMEEAEITN